MPLMQVILAFALEYCTLCTASSLALVIAFVQDNRAIIPKPRYLITSLRDHPLGKLTML